MPRAAAPKAKRAARHGQSAGADSKAAQPKRARRRAGADSPAVGVLQPKLRVGAPDDQFEREADHVADRVMSMPAPAARSGATAGRGRKEEESKPVQRKEAEGEKQAQTSSLQREEKEAGETSSVQRQAAEEGTAGEVAQTPSLQRRADEKEQTCSVQREEKEEEEKSSSLQRKEDEDEDEEEEKSSSLQRKEEEEEESSSLQRRAAGGEEERMQRRARRPRRPDITPQFETDLRLLRRAGGQPLPDHLRAFLEPRFGRSLGDVRVHVDHSAAELAQRVNARAFTVGRHIVFGAGEYRPGVEQGRRLIAHELTHVFQQRGGLHSVQREVGPERAAAADPQADLPSLEELRAAFKIDAASAPPSILSVAVVLLRNALRSPSNAQRLRPLTRSEGETAALVRAIHSGAYTLELASLRGGREKGWKLTQRNKRETFVSRSNSSTQQWPAATAGNDTITLPTPPAAEDYPEGTLVAGLETVPPGDRAEVKKLTPLIPKTVSADAAPDSKPSPPAPAPKAQTAPAAAPAAAKVVAAEAPAKSVKEAAPAAATAKAAARPSTPEAPAAAEEGAPAAAAEPEHAPRDPKEDPEFQKTLGQIRHTRKAQGAHIPSDEKLQHTKDATVLKENKQREKNDRDKHLTQIDATAKKTESVPFTPKEFKELLSASIKKIEDKLPKNEGAAKRFKKEKPLEETKEEVRCHVKKKNEEIAGPLATQVDPRKPPPPDQTFEPKPTAELKEEEVGKKPRNINPVAAAPKPRLDSELSMEKESRSLDDLMAENAMTEEQLAESNEPTFVEALGSKKAAQEKAAQAPAEFRAVEQPVLDKSQARAGHKGASKFGAMFKGRGEVFGVVSGKQKLTVKDDKAKQEEILAKLKTIYEGTKTDVETILDNLSTTVDTIFNLRVALAKNFFESRVESQLDDIYGWTTWDDTLFGADTEAIEAVFQREKERFLETMDEIIDQIAKFIADMLNAAMARIKRGRKEADDLFATLSKEQQKLSTDAMETFRMQFTMLEDGVREKQQDLADTLAESYKSNVDSLRETFDKIKEDISKGWIGAAIDFIESVADVIKKLGELLMSILSRIGNIVGDILAHPIRFIENLARGVGDGFDTFIEKLDEYLIAGFFDWLRGTVGGPGIQIPDKFDAAGIFSLVAQVVGLSYETFRKVAAKVWGRAAVEFIDQGKAVAEKGLEIYFIVKEKGLGGLWEHIKEHLGSMVDELMTKVKETVLYEVIKKALAYIAGLFNPVGAFVKAAQAIYAGIRFLMDNIQRIADIVDAFLDSLELAVAGKTDAISEKIVTALRGVIVIAIDFLAKLLGLGDLDDKVRKILKVIRTPVERALEVVLKALRPLVQKVMRKLGVGKDEEEAEKKVEKEEGREPETHDEVLAHVARLMAQKTKADTPDLALTEKREQAENLIKKYQPMLKQGHLKVVITDPSVEAVEKDAAVDFEVSASEGIKGEAPVGVTPVPVPQMVVTPPFSDQKAADMTVKYLYNEPGNHPPGKGTSGYETLHGAWAKLEELGVSRKQWKSGHMLNKDFGGPPENSNLIPIPTRVNNAQTAFDEDVSEKLYKPKKPIWMHFTVQRNHPEDAEHRLFVSHYKVEAAEMTLHGDKYEAPATASLKFEKSGADLAYPARRTTDLTLNGLIKSKDKSNKSVREVSGATYLSERLVKALVERGQVLNGVKDIEEFIRATYTGKRLTDYLIILETYGDSIQVGEP